MLEISPGIFMRGFSLLPISFAANPKAAASDARTTPAVPSFDRATLRAEFLKHYARRKLIFAPGNFCIKVDNAVVKQLKFSFDVIGRDVVTCL